MTEFVFGQRILTRVKLKRTNIYPDRRWMEIPIPEKIVRVIGKRTLSNVSVDSSEYGTYYEPREYFKALLVVEKMSSNPFYIKIE